MLLSGIELKKKLSFSSEVENTQIDFINDNRLASVSSMALGAILIYFLMQPNVESFALSLWLAIILSVDFFRLYANYSYNRDKCEDCVDYKKAYTHLQIGTVLSGCCWGSLSLILVPLLHEQALMLVIIWLLVIATASTTTLSYIYSLTVIFVSLVLIPLMLSLPMQEYITGTYLVAFEVAIGVLTLFLIKNANGFSRHFNKILQLQINSQNHENELLSLTKKAEFANHSKSEFLANMSHELRTPMHAILGFSNLGGCKVGTATDEKISSYFTRINESGQRLLHLLNDLLDLSKLEAGQMNFDFSKQDMLETINVVVEELKPLFDERSLSLDIKPVWTDTQIEYDDEKMQQVIRNLLSNAIKFTPVGKLIHISIEDTELLINENLIAAEKVDAISISITDQGSGIPKGELETVFNKFVQSTETASGAGGTGLGLSISKVIIDGHKGSLSACNSDNEGAVFTIVIPRNR